MHTATFTILQRFTQGRPDNSIFRRHARRFHLLSGVRTAGTFCSRSMFKFIEAMPL